MLDIVQESGVCCEGLEEAVDFFGGLLELGQSGLWELPFLEGVYY